MNFVDWSKLPTEERIKAIGHRKYIGGADPEMWYSIGRLQYHFLISQGLRHDHTFLDIACGALRLGQFLIPYMDTGKYCGLDQSPSLVEAAKNAEIPQYIFDMKKPKFAFNSDFDFSSFKGFDYAIAQSLFTHLTPADIKLCLSGLRPIAGKESRFYFTFFKGDSAKNPTDASHPNLNFWYVYEEIEAMAKEVGWKTEYIADWGHPRRQQMILARPA